MLAMLMLATLMLMLATLMLIYTLFFSSRMSPPPCQGTL